MQFLIIGFDGMRADLLKPDLTPNLTALADLGVAFANHRCVYPSETFVNLSSLVTGSPPSGHGMVANRFVNPDIDPGEVFDPSSVALVEKAQRRYGGALYTTPSLGELLGDVGLSMAVISTLYPGLVRLKHHRVDAYRHLSFACSSLETSAPYEAVADIVERLGPPPKDRAPNLSVLPYATDVFLDLAGRDSLPEVTVLWFVEPDDSCHAFGVGSAEMRQALRCADAQLGRIVDWWQGSAYADTLQIIVTSDHGQITQTRPVSVGDDLRNLGFKVAGDLGGECDCSIVPDYSGNIRLARPDPGLRREVVEALMSLDHCGMIFTKGCDDSHEGTVPGTFALDMVQAGHPRASDIHYILRTDDAVNAAGYDGACCFENELAVGSSYHGGLYPAELAAVCVASGSHFKSKVRSPIPSGIVDIAPTILHALGVPRPNTMTGRVLEEAIAHSPVSVSPTVESFDVRAGNYGQYLRRSRVNGSIYLEAGWRQV